MLTSLHFMDHALILTVVLNISLCTDRVPHLGGASVTTSSGPADPEPRPLLGGHSIWATGTHALWIFSVILVSGLATLAKAPEA